MLYGYGNVKYEKTKNHKNARFSRKKQIAAILLLHTHFQMLATLFEIAHKKATTIEHN